MEASVEHDQEAGIEHDQEASIEHDQEASVEQNQEANVEHDQETNAAFNPEVATGPTLKIGLRIGQEVRLRIIIKLIPKMNRPFPRTISGNPRIGGSAFRFLKMEIQ